MSEDEAKKAMEALENGPDLEPEAIEGIKDEETRKMLANTHEQKKHWREKVKKSEERIAKLEADLAAKAEGR